MAQLLTPTLTVTSRANVRRIRELPVPGKVLVSLGDTVSASAEVAEAELQGDLMIAKLPEQMGIEAFEALAGLKCRAGDAVKEGDLLCEHSGLFGLFKTRYRSTVTGTVEMISERTAHLGIRLPSRRIAIRAYLSGTVVEIAEGKGVTIECSAALVQGVFGIGGERHGTVRVFSSDLERELTAEDIPADCAGLILVARSFPSLSALQTAAARGAVSFICGGIDDRALTGYVGHDIGVAVTGDEDVSMNVIVTEGFGAIPMDDRSFTLLNELDGREASTDGTTQVRAGAVRPEIVIPRPELAGAAPDEPRVAGLEVGASVRLIRFPYFGLQGEVVELPPAPEEIETGARARVLKVLLPGKRTVTVPRSNVELL